MRHFYLKLFRIMSLPVCVLGVVWLFLGGVFNVSIFGINPAWAQVPDADDLPSHQLIVNGHKRTFYWYTPEEARDTPLPVVVLLHGYKGNAEEILKLSGMLKLAQKEPLILLIPEGRQATWNIHAIKGQYDDQDLHFIDGAIEFIKYNASVDTQRIYAMGMSNGGFLATRLACERPNTFAAVGAVSATLAKPLLTEDCQAGSPVPVAMINGTKDPVVLWDGGLGKLKSTFPDSEIAGVEDTLAFWRERHQCQSPLAKPVHVLADELDDPIVLHYSYQCESSSPASPVQQWTVVGGGHTWPKSPQRFTIKSWIYRRFVGRTTRNLNATEALWQFFQQHTKRAQ